MGPSPCCGSRGAGAVPPGCCTEPGLGRRGGAFLGCRLCPRMCNNVSPLELVFSGRAVLCIFLANEPLKEVKMEWKKKRGAAAERGSLRRASCRRSHRSSVPGLGSPLFSVTWTLSIRGCMAPQGWALGSLADCLVKPSSSLANEWELGHIPQLLVFSKCDRGCSPAP